MTTKTFREDEDVEALANKVITTNKLEYLSSVKIKYLLVSPRLSKTLIGKCIKPSSELQHFSGVDIIIEISNDVWEKIDTKSKETIMLHYLSHIQVKNDEENKTVKVKLINHDLEDFRYLIDKYGIKWFQELRVSISAIRQIEDPSVVDKIKV